MKKLIIPGLITLLGAIAILLSIVLFSTLWVLWFFVVLIFGIITLLCGIYEFYNKFKQKDGSPNTDDENTPKYKKKKRILTEVEKEFYELLKNLLSEKYYEVLTQVALVSVIDKITHTTYRNELFRIIDFCVIDKSTTKPLLLIELNDISHKRADRVERDRKVNDICNRAGITLITFTLDEIKDMGYVKGMLKRVLN